MEEDRVRWRNEKWDGRKRGITKEGEWIKRNGGDGLGKSDEGSGMDKKEWRRWIIGKSDGGICLEEDNKEREGKYLVQVEVVVAAGDPLVLSDPVPHLPVPPRVPVHRPHHQDPRTCSQTTHQSIIKFYSY